jgi:predicted RNA-binding protein with PUA-like domain
VPRVRGGHEGGEEGLGEDEPRQVIHLKTQFEAVFGEDSLVPRSAGADPGIVHEEVDPGFGGREGLGQGPHLVEDGEIRGDEAGRSHPSGLDGRHDLGSPFGVSAVNDDVHPTGPEFKGEGATEPVGGARDHGHRAVSRGKGGGPHPPTSREDKGEGQKCGPEAAGRDEGRDHESPGGGTRDQAGTRTAPSDVDLGGPPMGGKGAREPGSLRRGEGAGRNARGPGGVLALGTREGDGEGISEGEGLSLFLRDPQGGDVADEASPRYWLMKSEADVYSIDDLARDGKTPWDGIRNAEARNLMRDRMRPGDLILYYHSNAAPSGVAGIAKVASEPYADGLQFDPGSRYFDETSDPDRPRWILVDVAFVERFPRLVPLDEIRAHPLLQEMALLKRMRLSVQPVEPDAFEIIRELGQLTP